MTRRTWRRPLRALVLAWGVLHLVLPLGVLFVDASLGVTAAEHATTHIEAESTSACSSVHTDSCILCQFLSHGAAPVPAAQPSTPTECHATQPSAAHRVWGGRVAIRLPEGRAPPVV